MKKKKGNPCPCCSGKSYEECCGRFLEGDAYPQTARELMQSRYAAYATGRIDWVRKTWHPDHVPADLENDTQIKWLGLEVKAWADQDETHATVDFVARGRYANTGAFRMKEHSRFEKIDGRWLYVDGDTM